MPSSAALALHSGQDKEGRGLNDLPYAIHTQMPQQLGERAKGPLSHIMRTSHTVGLGIAICNG
jgi:hypothetical protein